MQTPSLTHRAYPGVHRPGTSLIRQRAASVSAPRAPIARAAQWGGFWDPESNINKAVFQHPQLPAIDNIAPGDARDALEACTGLEGEAKNACYCLFGCDPKGVEEYLVVVEHLESALQQEPDPAEDCWRLSEK